MRISETTTLAEALAKASSDPDSGLRLLDRREQATWVSWSQVEEESRLVASGLLEIGVQGGERVGLVYPTERDFFFAYFGTLLAGAVPVPLYPPVRLGRMVEYQERTASMLRAVDARLVLASARVRRVLGEAIRSADTSLGCRLLEELPRAAGDLPAVRPEDLALVQFSSGTTVDPKPVALTHRAIMAQVRILNSFWPDTPELRQTGASWLPLYHDMGLIGCVFPALERPSVLTLIPPELFVARPAVWLRAISRYRASVSPAPNFAYGLCLEKVADEEMQGVDLSCWQVALNGAESVSAKVLRAFAERFSRWGFEARALAPVYGLSEASLAVTFTPIGRGFLSRCFEQRALAEAGLARLDPEGMELVSVGRALPGFQVAVREAGGGRELAEGRVGRIWVRGPSLMKEYLNRPRATAEVLQDGWLDTGDLGFFHQGELFITGRAKDVLIVRGQNHAPEELERAVSGVPGVRSGCVAAVSRAIENRDTEEVWLFVERGRKVARRANSEINEDCRREILKATGLMVERVVVLEPGTLPRTSSGKVRRAEALRQYLAGELSPPRTVSWHLLLGAWLQSSWAFLRWHLRRFGGRNDH
jgi:fatty-acyl-CoA synthase